jgi:hypothetical protein
MGNKRSAVDRTLLPLASPAYAALVFIDALATGSLTL